jgi:ASC-1-like (ASCH) protein
MLDMPQHRTLVFREADKARFGEIRSGLKKIETRAGSPEYLAFAEGDVITFVCADDHFDMRIARRHHYAAVDELFAAIPYLAVMPAAASLEDAKERYGQYPGYESRIEKYGILAFELEPA